MKYACIPLRVYVAAALVAVMSVGAFPAHAQEAMDQLENAANTGTLFDGSDGDRFGTDTDIDAPGSVPDVPPPTAVDTPTDGDQAASNDSGSSDSSQPDDSESDEAGETGTEKAE